MSTKIEPHERERMREGYEYCKFTLIWSDDLIETLYYDTVGQRKEQQRTSRLREELQTFVAAKGAEGWQATAMRQGEGFNVYYFEREKQNPDTLTMRRTEQVKSGR